MKLDTKKILVTGGAGFLGKIVVQKLLNRGVREKFVKVDKRYYRPAEVNYLVADISKAKKILGWKPRTKFNDLVKIMVKADMEKIK